MLDSTGVRQLVYVVLVDDIYPIEGADRVELARVGGWTIMVRKGQFKVGDPAIYFEIDSKVPDTETFEFLAKKHYAVKTQKYFKGTIISQGLLMSAEDFGWTVYGDKIVSPTGSHSVENDSRFLTEELGVTYYVAEDNARKKNSSDKYAKMAQRHPMFFKKKPIRWLMKRTWGKKILFFFVGRKEDKELTWPNWVKKTDEERVQNMSWILKDKNPWIATEKIDGTSTTFTMKKKRFGKNEFYICSRNVVFRNTGKSDNVYREMAEKYNIREVLENLIKKYNLDWVTIQGETFGEGIQKRDYTCIAHEFKAFNLIFSDRGRLGTLEMRDILKDFKVPVVPIISKNYILPDTVEELLADVEGTSMEDGLPREGIVFRSPDGSRSFKAVSNEFLLKYHG